MNNSLQEIFARNLKERRKTLGLTQAEIAKSIGVSTSFITEIETGRKAPSFQTIERISASTGAPAWTFFCEYGDKIKTEESGELTSAKFALKEQINQIIDEVLTTK